VSKVPSNALDATAISFRSLMQRPDELDSNAHAGTSSQLQTGDVLDALRDRRLQKAMNRIEGPH
jgi:hypothetical protein